MGKSKVVRQRRVMTVGSTFFIEERFFMPDTNEFSIWCQIADTHSCSEAFQLLKID